MNLKDFEGKTNEQIKEKIITEFYLTGKVEGIYMNAYSNSNINPFKQYIKQLLVNFHSVVQNQEDYVDDLYQLTFELIWKIKTDKFIEDFFEDGEFNHQKFTRYACRILMLNGIYKKKGDFNNPKASLMTNLLYGSSLNSRNVQLVPELVDNMQSIDEHLVDYITPDLIEELMSEDERALYEKMLVKETKYYYNTVNPVYRQFADKLREIKKNGI